MKNSIFALSAILMATTALLSGVARGDDYSGFFAMESCTTSYSETQLKGTGTFTSSTFAFAAGPIQGSAILPISLTLSMETSFADSRKFNVETVFGPTVEDPKLESELKKKYCRPEFAPQGQPLITATGSGLQIPLQTSLKIKAPRVAAVKCIGSGQRTGSHFPDTEPSPRSLSISCE